METFKFEITVKHDTGKTKLTISATDLVSAVKIVCESEGCPECAIVSTNKVVKTKNKINKKYNWFALRKSDKKIVDGWDYPKSYDKDEVLEWYKIDMKDNDRPLKEYRLMAKKDLLAVGIDPFDFDNWGNYFTINN